MYDFVKKLINDPSKLEILGDGTAEKSYLHIEDCISALMLICEEKRPAKGSSLGFEIFHLGMEEFIQVSDSAKLIASQLGVSPKYEFGEGKRGWVGDNPFVLLDVSKIKGFGWHPRHTIKDSIKETTEWLRTNDWIFEDRA